MKWHLHDTNRLHYTKGRGCSPVRVSSRAFSVRGLVAALRSSTLLAAGQASGLLVVGNGAQDSLPHSRIGHGGGGMEVSGSRQWLVVVDTRTTVAHRNGEFRGEQGHWGARKQGSSGFNCHRSAGGWNEGIGMCFIRWREARLSFI